MSILISQLNIYPIKSCAGISVDSALIGSRGFYFDRLWMLIDENNKFTTQRTQPRMALIHIDLLFRGTQEKILSQVRTQSIALKSALSHPFESVTLRLTAPGMSPLMVNPTVPANNLCDVIIWRDVCGAVDEGDEAARWFRAYLDIECRLVRMHESFTRQVDQEYAKYENDQVSFADGYPFLLISESSLEDLNRKLDEPLPMNRFRPNIVVNGCKEFAEDTWQSISMNGIDFDLVKACARCSVTTTNQITAKVGPEPLRTLSKYRLVDNKVLFGQNLVHRSQGQVNIGDSLEVTMVD